MGLFNFGLFDRKTNKLLKEHGLNPKKPMTYMNAIFTTAAYCYHTNLLVDDKPNTRKWTAEAVADLKEKTLTLNWTWRGTGIMAKGQKVAEKTTHTPRASLAVNLFDLLYAVIWTEFYFKKRFCKRGDPAERGAREFTYKMISEDPKTLEAIMREGKRFLEEFACDAKAYAAAPDKLTHTGIPLMLKTDFGLTL